MECFIVSNIYRVGHRLCKVANKTLKKGRFVLENSVDHDEMPRHAAFHLGLHCMFAKVRIKESLD